MKITFTSCHILGVLFPNTLWIKKKKQTNKQKFTTIHVTVQITFQFTNIYHVTVQILHPSESFLRSMLSSMWANDKKYSGSHNS